MLQFANENRQDQKRDDDENILISLNFFFVGFTWIFSTITEQDTQNIYSNDEFWI